MRPRVDVHGVIDLSGVPPRWEPSARTRWDRCLEAANRCTRLETGPDRLGDPLLRHELAAVTGLPASELVITTGIRASLVPLLGRARQVVVERPSFADIPRMLEPLGVTVTRESWETFPRGADAYWVTSTLRNPDGRTAGAGFRHDLTQLAAEGSTVVCDTAFGWFSDFDVPAGAVSVGSLHKLAGPGARVGWVHVPGLENAVQRRLWAAAPAPAWQRAWGIFFERGGATHLQDGLRDAMAAASSAFCTEAGLPSAEARPHVLIEVADEDRAVAELRDVGVVVSPGAAFDSVGPAIRVALLGVEPRLAGAAGRRVADVVGHLGPG